MTSQPRRAAHSLISFTLAAALWGAAGCGAIGNFFAPSDERNVSGIADYGERPDVQDGNDLDPELESFWARVKDLGNLLPPNEAGRLQVNLRDLRVRLDRPAAELVLVIGHRLLDEADLGPYMRSGSLELALVLEQFAGEDLMRQLRQFVATKAADFPAFLSGSETVKPPDLLEEALKRADEILESFAATPEILPAAGNYSGPQLVRLSTPTPNARIYYTLDNSEPTEQSPQYSEPFLAGENLEFVAIKAVAFAPGMSPSSINLVTYTIATPQLSRPALSTPGGIYGQNLDLTVTVQDSAAVVRYTVDGATPTEQSPVFPSSLSLATEGTTTLKLRAFAPGKRASDVLVSSYTLDFHAPTFSPNSDLRAEDLTSTSFTIRWRLASDNLTASNDLIYQIAVAEDGAQIDSATKIRALTTACTGPTVPCVSGLIPALPSNGLAVIGVHPGTTYHYALIVRDRAGNIVHTGVMAVTTPSG